MSVEGAGVEWKLSRKHQWPNLNPFIAGFMIYFTYISSIIRSYLLILDC